MTNRDEPSSRWRVGVFKKRNNQRNN